MTDGRWLYEQDVKARPLYPDGSPRKTWEELDPVSQWSWNRPMPEITQTRANDDRFRVVKIRGKVR